MEKLKSMYFKTIEDIKNLEMDKFMFENTYLWGKGRELKHKKLKMKLIENRLWKN